MILNVFKTGINALPFLPVFTAVFLMCLTAWWRLWHTGTSGFGMGYFGIAVAAMVVSAMKCEVCFRNILWNVTKVQKFALTSSGTRVSARVSLTLVPDLSNCAVFIVIHDAYHGFGSAITAYSYTDKQPMARKYDIFLD